MAVAGSPFATDAVGAPLAMSRDAKFLYSINWVTHGSLLAFGIQADGSLLSVPGAPFVTAAQILLLVAHPTADFLYALDYSGNIAAYTINSATGALTLQPATSVAVQASAAVISPDGNHLYTLSTAGIVEYSVDTATGALTALAGSSIPNDLVPGVATIDPSGRFMYVTNTSVFTGFGGALYVFSIDPQPGAVTLISGFSPTVGPQESVAVDATGKYAVVSTVVTSKTGPDCFAVQSIDGTSGMLSPVPGSPFPGTYSNGSCGVLLADPSGSYLYAGSGGVGVYSLDETTGVPESVTSSALAGMVVTSLAVTH